MIIKIQERQSGKSTSIAKLMNTNKKSACITYTNQSRDIFCNNFHISKKRVFSIRSLINNVHIIHKFDIFYMDEVGLCLKMLIPKLVIGTHTNEVKQDVINNKQTK